MSKKQVWFTPEQIDLTVSALAMPHVLRTVLSHPDRIVAGAALVCAVVAITWGV
jgi:hypothetical protein